MPWDAVATVRLSTATLDNLLNETGELITCSVRSQQRSRESHLLAELPLRWRRVWRQIRPLISRLQMALPSFQPTVHHLDDRQSQIDMRTVEQAAARILNQNQGERGGKSNKNDSEETDLSAMSSQIPLLLDALTQANSLITELEQSLGQHARQSTEDYTRLSVVTDRLHDQIRRTRMLPLATLFNPLRLQLREIVRAAGKQVDLELDDGGAEADRQVLERLREVLLHLLRNAVDHGIESPEQRTAHGKSPTGHITLRAVVSGDYLTITIEDDGAGLELDEIRRKAIGGGLLSDADITRVTEAELIDLIFLPGFSTRQIVSKMSGRGVGLDIVRSQVERMHGRVTVQSFPGAGCAFTISVPLSLTSSHGLLLRVAHDTYMVPLDSIQRIVAVAPGEVQVLEGRTCLTLDHRPVALVHLADIVGKTERPAVKEERRPGGERGRGPLVNGRLATSSWSLALILGSGERQVACMVDAVLGEQELVIYRLPAPLQRIRFIAGATILADGSVVPILDVVDVVRAAIGVRQAMSFSATEVAQQERRNTILVVDDSITTRTLEKNILEAAGYEVKLATDGVEALDMLRQLVENDGGCDLLLSDIDMPRLNGFDLTSQVRNDASFKHLPIVLVTSLDSPADRERGIAAGADAYIVKRAFDQQNLLETIEQLI
jgi:two-component system chemotaxis sensor kinase CheA